MSTDDGVEMTDMWCRWRRRGGEAAAREGDDAEDYAAAAEAQLEEHKQLAATLAELQTSQAAQSEQAARRIAELEAELSRRDAAAAGAAGGSAAHAGGSAAHAGASAGGAEADRLRIEAQAQADATAALAAGPRALQAARARRELTRLRARMASPFLQPWRPSARESPGVGKRA